MKKLNNKGFGVVEVLLVLVIVAIVGGIGWYVAKGPRKTAEDTSPSVPVQTTKTPAKAPVVQSPDWERVTSSGKKFSLLVPDGWAVYNSPERNSIYVSDDVSGENKDKLKIIEGKKVTIYTSDIKRGMSAPFSAVLYETTSESTPEGKVHNVGKVGGYEVTRYEYHPTESFPDSAQPGDIQYRYWFGNTKFAVTYVHVKGQPSHLSDIEKIVKSVKLNL